MKAIVAKGRDRNDAERKFINGLNKAGMAAQADGNVVKNDAAVAAQSADGSTVTTTAQPKRQQPKRQSKSQRQAKPAGEAEPKTSLTKSDEPQDAEPVGKQDAKPAAGAKEAGSGSPAAVAAARPSPDSARARSGPSPRRRSKKESIP